ncbi:hypothetical protein JTB14_007223 [Gonioctena quinquepunctata]|nr:hypothetical protein JTB14_007223 [Gonioctena quinquepunctata]
MSFLSTPYSVRLQDLKLWQGNYDTLMKYRSSEVTGASDYDTVEGLSTFDSTHSSPLCTPVRKHVDWDKKAITPVKPFDQLLEEKLAEDEPIQVQVKPKKPFLKKGTGLIRYRSTPRPSSNKATKKTRPASTSSESRIQKSRQTPERHKNCFNKSVPAGDGTELTLTPLKVPDLCIKPKATWIKYPGDGKIKNDVEDTYVPEFQKTPRQIFNSHIFGKINELTLKRFVQGSPQTEAKVPHSNNNFIDFKHQKSDIAQKNNCSLGNTTDKELHIFEALEERAENSSFSSTNSSIIRLLSSTPNKVRKSPTKSPIIEEKIEELKHDIDSRLLVQKLQEVNSKTDVLNNFLQNLKKFSSEKQVEESTKFSLETSFSEEEKWSKNTDTRSQSPSSFYTDFENTFIGNTKVDIAVNTSFEEKEENKTITCDTCEELRNKLSKLSKEVPDIQAEKARLCDFAKDLEKKRDQLSKEIVKLKKKYEEDTKDLQTELEEEKKKFSREKAVFDMYIKESQNRPNKKEREEITNLKKELADVKELLKLKDTKNGATQARLRNTIKQLEKERQELKGTVDNLQKENAKFKAAKQIRRPSESKMLQEINKNLSKLAEETFKKQLNKSDSDVKKERRNETEEIDENVEGELLHKMPKKMPSSLKKKSSYDYTLNEDNTTRETTFANLSIEKQYENTFKQVPDPGPQKCSSADLRKGTKIETIFPDGSKEIKYSNGNSKTISPNGKLIIVQYYNGDVKETNLTDNTIKYYYAENSTWHTQFGDGSELFEYPNGQQERKYKDGKEEVTCPDGPSLTKMPDGSEEVIYPDGSKIIKNIDGEKILMLPNGQKEIHTKDHKRREYPDGTVKIVYLDGTQETRYASGRLRIKDANGLLIVDSHQS